MQSTLNFTSTKALRHHCRNGCFSSSEAVGRPAGSQASTCRQKCLSTGDSASIRLPEPSPDLATASCTPCPSTASESSLSACSSLYEQRRRATGKMVLKPPHRCELRRDQGMPVAHPVNMQPRHLPDRVQGFGRGLEGQRAEAGLVQCHSHAPCIRLQKLVHLVVILPYSSI